MPAFRHGKSTRLLLDQHDISAYFRGTSVNNAADEADSTTYGADIKTYVAGLPDFGVSLEGLFDGTEGAIDEILQASVDSDDTNVLTIAPEGLATGRRVWIAVADQVSYDIGSPVTDVVSVAANFRGAGLVRSGYSLHTLAPETISGNSTSIDNTAASTTGGVGTLHVTANTRDAGSLVVTIEDSADNAAWATIATFATVNAGTANVLADTEIVAGTVRRYVRALWTVTGGTTGSYTFAVSFART